MSKSRVGPGALCAAVVLSTIVGTVPAAAQGADAPSPAPPLVVGPPPAPTITYEAPPPAGGPVPTTPSGRAQPADGSASATTSAPAPSGTASALAFSAPPNRDFVFNYGSGITAQEKAVFEAAAGIWSSVLDVRVPIRVDASKSSLPAGVLGAAGPTSLYADLPALPVDGVWFVPAEANQYAGKDLDTSTADISMTMSADEPFYEQADGNVPPDQISLLALVLHELGHGLGHTTLAAKSSGGQYSIRLSGYPLAFDYLLVNSSGTQLINLSSSALGAALTSRVLWGGWSGADADGGYLPEIYAPSTFQPGSSASHLDESTYPGALMTPSIAPGESQLSIPVLTQSMLWDFGWVLESKFPNEAFVHALTIDFLDRLPTWNELIGRSAALEFGNTTREATVRAYAYSDEWIGALVNRLYRSVLGRDADPAGRSYWIQRIRNGMTPAEVAAYFYAGDEYYASTGGTSTSWIRALYREILHREADSSGLAYWRDLVDRGTPRSGVAYNFYQSIESRRTRVTALYVGLLGRKPDSEGREYWAGILSNGRDVDLAAYLAASNEYFTRANRRFGWHPAR